MHPTTRLCSTFQRSCIQQGEKEVIVYSSGYIHHPVKPKINKNNLLYQTWNLPPPAPLHFSETSFTVLRLDRSLCDLCPRWKIMYWLMCNIVIGNQKYTCVTADQKLCWKCPIVIVFSLQLYCRWVLHFCKGQELTLSKNQMCHNFVEHNCHSEMSLAPKLDVAKRSIPFKRSTQQKLQPMVSTIAFGQ